MCNGFLCDDENDMMTSPIFYPLHPDDRSRHLSERNPIYSSRFFFWNGASKVAFFLMKEFTCESVLVFLVVCILLYCFLCASPHILTVRKCWRNIVRWFLDLFAWMCEEEWYGRLWVTTSQDFPGVIGPWVHMVHGPPMCSLQKYDLCEGPLRFPDVKGVERCEESGERQGN